MPTIIWVQAGVWRIKIFPQALNRADIRPYPDQEALVWMQVLVLTPE